MPTTPTTSRVGETTLQSKKILKNRINTDAPILSNATPAAQTLRKSPNGKTYKSTPSPVTLPASKQGANGRTPSSTVPPIKRKHVNGRWSEIEDKKLRAVVKELGGKNWKKISQVAFNGSRTDVQCLHRWQKVLRPGLHKGPWSKQEDAVVFRMVEKVGGVEKVKWSVIAAELPGRLGKQVRERWYNHLDPTLNKGPWTAEEDKMLTNLQKTIGNKWCQIAKMLPGRSENAVKNRWNSAQRRQRQQQRRKENGGAVKKVRKKRSKTGAKKRKTNATPPPAATNTKKTILDNNSVPPKKRKLGRIINNSKKTKTVGKNSNKGKGKPNSPCNIAAGEIGNVMMTASGILTTNVDPAIQLCLMLSNAFENDGGQINSYSSIDVLHNLHKTASIIAEDDDHEMNIDDDEEEATTPKTILATENRSTPPDLFEQQQNILKMIPDNILNAAGKVVRRPSLSDNDVNAACLSLISF